jgi:iron complex outermembrane recepter protein
MGFELKTPKHPIFYGSASLVRTNRCQPTILASAVCLCLYLLSTAAFAQDALDEIIVTGTRDPHQTAQQSLSPISVLSAGDLNATGQTDLRDALVFLAPSISHQDVGNGPSAMIDSINLRGLTSNQTLVLVDGVRRHVASTFYYSPGLQQGTTPVDIDMIPASMIDHIEVLQDGAAAQYGSDAIAGVVNIILKTNANGFTARTLNGQYYAGDGFSSLDSLNKGFALGDSGFVSLSGEFKTQNHTDRGEPDNRTGVHDNPVLGQPAEHREAVGYNAGYDLDDNWSIGSNATFAHRNGYTYQNFRLPSILPQVYPDGFVPIETSDENDYSANLILKAKDLLGWNAALSTTYGGNHNDIGMDNTVNQSFYATYGYTPTDFQQMSFKDSQWTTNLDLRRGLDVGFLPQPLNLAMGYEHRYETYGIGAGEYAAYYGSGPQAQHGLTPNEANTSSRNVNAAYVDLAASVTSAWKIDLAGRYENYSDSDHTLTGKVSSRYDFNPIFALRGTASTGFRAPTLAEEHFTNVTDTPTGASGILAVDSVAAKALGAAPLKPEKSDNYSVGFVLNPAPLLNFSVDAYRISIRDRIVVGGAYSGQQALDAFNEQGIGLPGGLILSAISAQYLSNAADTRTDGLDVSGDYLMKLGNAGDLRWSLAANINKTEIQKIYRDRNGNLLLNDQQQSYLTSNTPDSKVVFGAHWTGVKWSVNLSETRFGNATSVLTYQSGPNANSSTVFDAVEQTPKYRTDLQVARELVPGVRLSLGANNLFDAKPTALPPITRYLGVAIYDINIQGIGINGGFYYAALDITF